MATFTFRDSAWLYWCAAASAMANSLIGRCCTVRAWRDGVAMAPHSSIRVSSFRVFTTGAFTPTPAPTPASSTLSPPTPAALSPSATALSPAASAPIKHLPEAVAREAEFGVDRK